MTTLSEAAEIECCTDREKKCVGTQCMGWRWHTWRAGMAVPMTATTSGPTQRLMIDGAEHGYCGLSGADEYS